MPANTSAPRPKTKIMGHGETDSLVSLRPAKAAIRQTVRPTIPTNCKELPPRLIPDLCQWPLILHASSAHHFDRLMKFAPTLILYHFCRGNFPSVRTGGLL